MEFNKWSNFFLKKCGNFHGGKPKVAERFVREMVYGIQASQSVVLTKIGRMLEQPISLKKVEERLSQQLLRRGIGQKIQHNLLTMVAKHVGKVGDCLPNSVSPIFTVC